MRIHRGLGLIMSPGSEAAGLSAEMNTSPSSGWSLGSNVTNDGGGVYGFTAPAGTLSKNFSIVLGERYLISWDIGANPSDTCGHLAVSLGAVSASYLWSCTDTGVFPRTATLTAAATGSVALTFTPDTDFHGHISNISLKHIDGTMTANITQLDLGTAAFEVRGNSTLRLLGIGTDVFKYNLDPGLTGDFGDPGEDNEGFGNEALSNNSAGYKNSAFGSLALKSNRDGFYNSAMGYGALEDNTLGFRNSAFGVLALKSNTSGYLNTAVGDEALYANTTGTNNTAFGPSAAQDQTTAVFNSAFGVAALNFNVTGNYNAAFGGEALQNLKSGSENVAIGIGALKGNNTDGSVPASNAFNYNTAVGTNAGIYLKDANDSYNVLLGHYAGVNYFDQTDNNKKIQADTEMVFVGASATKNSGSTLSNGVGIGYRALVTQSNEFVLGNSSMSRWSLGAQFFFTQDTGRLGANGLRLQTTNATNSPTYIAIVSKGTEDETGLRLYNVADPSTDHGEVTFNINGSTAQIGASSGGSGTAPNKLKLDSLALQLTVYTYSSLPTCNGGNTGMLVGISDSNVGAFGDAITGSGANQGLAYCGGAAWTFR